jgi:Rad3-related DNA helicase
MTGRLIRSEEDRGIVVIVEGRTDRAYFPKLERALPPNVDVRVIASRDCGEKLPEILSEIGLGSDDIG